jgi:hypothetical protein
LGFRYFPLLLIFLSFFLTFYELMTKAGFAVVFSFSSVTELTSGSVDMLHVIHGVRCSKDKAMTYAW